LFAALAFKQLHSPLGRLRENILCCTSSLRSSHFGAVEAVDLRRGFPVHARATVSAGLRLEVDLVDFRQSTMERMPFNTLLLQVDQGSTYLKHSRFMSDPRLS
jgi:hypothetical protein